MPMNIFNIKANLSETTSNELMVNFNNEHLVWSCQNYIKTSLSISPSPEELMLSAIVSSTLLALGYYIKLNKLYGIKIKIEASLELSKKENIVNQILIIDGTTEKEKEKLLDIADRSSMHTWLGNDLEIITYVSE
jgi:uncharacterized OsmC-like protein